MINLDFTDRISRALNIAARQVKNTLQLFSEDATVPFIARYRKEATGSLDEVQITAIRDECERLEILEKRRETIIASIVEQEKMTPELQRSIENAQTISELEDIYLPYKPKRRTKATIAKEKGLEPLAKMIMAQSYNNPEAMAERFVSQEKGVNTIKEALSGACDIIAEWMNEHIGTREKLRNLFRRKAIISSVVVKDKEAEAQKYTDWFDWSEMATKAPSHRVLAMFRGENEGLLRIKIEPDSEEALEIMEKTFIKNDSLSSNYVLTALEDSYKRLLSPSIENEIRTEIKDAADKKAIAVFAENLKQLLLSPPLGGKNVLAIDPGFRTGCKIVCLNKQGDLLHNETIYPHPPQNEAGAAMNKITSLVKAYKIEAIAIGNGTAGRETEDLIRRMKFDTNLIAVMVNENGASIYSASDVARREFPDYDVTVRGSVSIGRRLQDPLAELVKIDPKSIGVGQYQHDVNQKWLKTSLEDTVVHCVNLVGVNLNTASRELLSYVSGLSTTVAEKIVQFREENGAFSSRKELLKISRFGNKTFELAAGFLRIPEAKNPLDNSAVHPESYHIVEKMAKDLKVKVDELIGNKELIATIHPELYVTTQFGLPTLNDIITELKRPGLDPRKLFEFLEFDKNIRSINDIKPGMTLPGIVTNITAFGAFIDLGVHTSGLLHISQLGNGKRVEVSQVLSLNQSLTLKVLDVDYERKRISLGLA